MQANFQLLTRDSALAGGLQIPFTQSQTPDNIVANLFAFPCQVRCKQKCKNKGKCEGKVNGKGKVKSKSKGKG